MYLGIFKYINLGAAFRDNPVIISQGRLWEDYFYVHYNSSIVCGDFYVHGFSPVVLYAAVCHRSHNPLFPPYIFSYTYSPIEKYKQ